MIFYGSKIIGHIVDGDTIKIDNETLQELCWGEADVLRAVAQLSARLPYNNETFYYKIWQIENGKITLCNE